MSGVLAMLLGIGGAPGIINGSLPNGTSSGANPAAWQLRNDGQYAIRTGLSGDWVTPASSTVAAFYQVKVDVTGGAFTAGDGGAPSDSTGTWLDLSTSRIWYRNAAGTVTFTVSIREKATGIVRSTQAGVTITYT